jgi:hypothetical protein
MELFDQTLEEFVEEFKSNRSLFRYKTLNVLGYYIACHIFVEILKGVNYLHHKKTTNTLHGFSFGKYSIAKEILSNEKKTN